MQLFWDGLKALLLLLTSTRFVIASFATGIFYWFSGELMSWAGTVIKLLPGDIEHAVSALKDHLWSGWTADAGGYWTTEFLEGVHFFLGLNVLHNCITWIVSTLVGVLMYKACARFLPFVG